MARDYKHRAQSRPYGREPSAVWKWVAIGIIAGIFAILFYTLRDSEPDEPVTKTVKIEAPEKKNEPPVKTAAKDREEHEKPRFEFYDLLRANEVVVPEHEIKIRKREEKLGRSKPGSYTLQAGSFRNIKQADKLKAQLALLGVEARIETVSIGNATWNRIKIGPFANVAALDRIRSRLRQNDIDSVVIEAPR